MTQHQPGAHRALPYGKLANGKLQRLLDALPPDLRLEMEGMWEYRTLSAGAVVIEDGQEAERIGYVLDGVLVMVKELSDGRRHIIGLLTPYDMFGRAFNGASGYRIEALTDTQVLTCNRVQFEHLITRSIEAEQLFLRNLLDELDAAREWVIALGGAKVVQRLASLLLILSRHKFNGACGKPTCISSSSARILLITSAPRRNRSAARFISSKVTRSYGSTRPTISTCSIWRS
jgi:CRP/FNR family transcriptional regulator